MEAYPGLLVKSAAGNDELVDTDGTHCVHEQDNYQYQPEYVPPMASRTYGLSTVTRIRRLMRTSNGKNGPSCHNQPRLRVCIQYSKK